MRNQLAAKLASQLGGYVTHSQPVILFINGEPWGIYYIRERVDRPLLGRSLWRRRSADFLDSPEHFQGTRCPDGRP